MKKILLLVFIFGLFFSSCVKDGKIEGDSEFVKLSEENKEVLNEEVDKLLEEKDVELDELIDEEDKNEMGENKKVVEDKKVVSNLNDLINECKKLNDKEEYCNTKKKLVLENGKTTYGTCRSLAKHRKDFQKKTGFVKNLEKRKDFSKDVL